MKRFAGLRLGLGLTLAGYGLGGETRDGGIMLAILVEVLHHDMSTVRQSAARALGAVGANDPNSAPMVIKALDGQAAQEAISKDYADEQHRRLVTSALKNARQKIIQNVRRYLEIGGKLADPDAFTWE